MLVRISDLFDLQKIADSGQCFRTTALADGSWRFLTGDQVLRIRPAGGDDYEVSCSREAWDRVWTPYFDLGRCYREIVIPPEDRFLQKAAQAGAGIRILRQDPWETLMTFLISQRKSIPAIREVVELLSARYGVPFPPEAGEILYQFPTPERLRDVTEEDYRACKAGYRASYLRDAVRRVLSGELDLRAISALPDEGLLSALETVRGVGVKVASCVALFAYGRAACAPVDTWIQRIILREYGGRNPFARYGEAAGIMQQFLFYYAQLHKADMQACDPERGPVPVPITPPRRES